jgi:hypothetical protein
MPQLAGIFSHVIVDVSSIKALCIRWFPKGKLFFSTHANLTWPSYCFHPMPVTYTVILLSTGLTRSSKLCVDSLPNLVHQC